MKRFLPLTLVVAAMLSPLPGRAAEAYPSKPIRMIVSFAAGGPNETSSHASSGRR